MSENKDGKSAATIFDDQAVKKLAKLAALEVSGEATKKVAEKLNNILGYVERLQEVNVDNIQPMSHVHGSTNVFAEDVVAPHMPVQDLLKITPESSGRFIKVPIVIEE